MNAWTWSRCPLPRLSVTLLSLATKGITIRERNCILKFKVSITHIFSVVQKTDLNSLVIDIYRSAISILIAVRQYIIAPR